MIEAIKERWICALRGDLYKQGTGQLVKDGHFCCLGVLSDLYIADHDGVTWDDPMFKDDWEILPPKVAEWAGLGMFNTNPEVEMYDEEFEDTYSETLADVNDGGYDFSFIADLIEKQL